MYRFSHYCFSVLFSALTLHWILLPPKACSQSNELPAIQIITSEYAPFNYLEDGRPTGFCTEIVQEILNELHMNVPIQTIPWARGYKMALKQENTLIYTTARIPEREALFQWAGILVESQTYLFSAKKRAIRLESLDQAHQYRIGTSREDLRTKYLINQGFMNLDQVANAEMNAVKLMKNRIDLWVEDEIAAAHTVRRLGHRPEAVLSKSLLLNMGSTPKGYLAFSLNTAPQLVELFQNALERIKIDGRYDDIRKKYVN